MSLVTPDAPMADPTAPPPALPALPSLVHLAPAMPAEPPEPPLDDGTGPLRFYCSKAMGVRDSKATPLLNERDRNGPRSILCNFAEIRVRVLWDGVYYEFPSSEHAFQALKFVRAAGMETDPALKQAYMAYAQVVGNARTPNRSYLLAQMKTRQDGELNTSGGGDRTFGPNKKTGFPGSPDFLAMKAAFDAGVRNVGPKWTDADRVAVMDLCLYAKFVTNADERPKQYLLSTGDRELVEHTTRDAFWGDGGDGTGANQLGKALMRIRTQLREWDRFN